mgnify:CR=1 FL=1
MKTENNNRLFFFTAQYPFGLKEEFVAAEIIGLSKRFKEIVVVPFGPLENIERELPSNCVLEKVDLNKSKLTLRDNLRLIQLLVSEIFKSKKGVHILRKSRSLRSEAAQSMKLSKQFIQMFDSHNASESDYYYSTWMNESALALAFVRERLPQINFTIRNRGYDLFDERREGNYMPFRNYIFKHSSKVLAVSEFGRDYLRAKNVYPEKIHCNYNGVKEGNFELKSLSSKLTLVSCSYLLPIKRVDVLASALHEIDFELKWIHFGDGPEEDKIKRIVNDLPKNIEIELRGAVNPAEIIKEYESGLCDAFIHLSESEGFGMAILEAISRGIPTILYPAGGVNDFMSESHTIEIKEPFNVNAVVESIKLFQTKFYKNEEVRADAFNFFKSKFTEEKNLDELYAHILGD